MAIFVTEVGIREGNIRILFRVVRGAWKNASAGLLIWQSWSAFSLGMQISTTSFKCPRKPQFSLCLTIIRLVLEPLRSEYPNPKRSVGDPETWSKLRFSPCNILLLASLHMNMVESVKVTIYLGDRPGNDPTRAPSQWCVQFWNMGKRKSPKFCDYLLWKVQWFDVISEANKTFAYFLFVMCDCVSWTMQQVSSLHYRAVLQQGNHPQ